MSELDAATGSLRTGLRRFVIVAALLVHGGTARAECVGDCDNTGVVTISDLILGVNIALGNQPPSACPPFQNAQGQVDIAQLIKGVNNALNACPAEPTETPTIGNPDTPTSTATAVATGTDTPTPPATAVATATNTLSETATLTPTSVATATSTATSTEPQATVTPTHTPPSTATDTPSPTPPSTATATVTATATLTPTITPTASPTETQFPVGDTVAGHAAIVSVGLGSVQSIIAAVVAEVTNKGPMVSALVTEAHVGRGIVLPDQCPISGTTTKVCSEMGAGISKTIQLSLSASQCVAAGPAGGTAEFNGTISVDSSPFLLNSCDPVLFVSGMYAADQLEVTFRNDNLDTTLDATANLTGNVSIITPDPNCLVGKLNLSLNGSLVSKLGDFFNGEGVEVDFADTTMTMDQITYNDDCVPIEYRLTFNGQATVIYIPPLPALVALNGLVVNPGVSVQFSNFILKQNANTDPVTVEMSGTMNSDCFGGAVGLQTFVPVAVAAGQLCPDAGGITVTSAGATAMVTYDDGAVTVEQNGMQQTFPICVADELLECPAPPA
jgi:hypothetical protein